MRNRVCLATPQGSTRLDPARRPPLVAGASRLPRSATDSRDRLCRQSARRIGGLARRPVAWMWVGVMIMVLGGGMSLSDRRYRIGAPTRTQRRVESAAAAQ